MHQLGQHSAVLLSGIVKPRYDVFRQEALDVAYIKHPKHLWGEPELGQAVKGPW